MPTYEYKCAVCNHIQEVRHSISKDPLIPCEICGCIAIRQISGGGMLDLKGSGFYQNDYKKKGKKCEY